jgi:hypothetical protein
MKLTGITGDGQIIPNIKLHSYYEFDLQEEFRGKCNFNIKCSTVYNTDKYVRYKQYEISLLYGSFIFPFDYNYS